MKKTICLSLFCLLASPPVGQQAHAGETPETILIRQALSKDISGYRRADSELTLKTYDERFVAYQGHANGDPRAWTILHENRDALAKQINADLKAHRYETTRTIPLISVRTTHAFATTIDSGQVIDRTSGATTPVSIQRLWIFLKTEDQWLATAMVSDLGDALLPTAASGTHGDIADLLQRESQAWEDGNPSDILGLFDEHFTGYDGHMAFKPATWTIVFSGIEEMGKWLDKRLPYTQYDLDRKILYSAVGPAGNEALAVTRETVAIQHTAGPAKHQKERYVLWTMSRRSGSWKITNMLYDLGLTD
ncbi:MAG TPA: hypothetical protein EYG11_24920 [Candidatus Latescibacteria bacterium]|nr:hypothetical protein [Candidatus Handelsmanbacteria bacterium]HIL11943.1 hypothetical protein [Candidatus Latescibacterota bacterium]